MYHQLVSESIVFPDQIPKSHDGDVKTRTIEILFHALVKHLAGTSMDSDKCDSIKRF